MLTRRVMLAATAIGLAAPTVLSRASAQTIKRPARLIVGFPAGGGTDVIARILAEQLRGKYAPVVLVENKPGAAGRLAIEHVRESEPDGSTLLFTPDFLMTVYPHSFRSLSYDPLRDFAAVAPTTLSMQTYSVGPAVPESVKTLAGFVQWCKANPTKAAYATTSAGGTPHFVGLMLAQKAGLDMTAVHYRGGAPALQDLLGGHVPASVNPISETLPMVQSGSLRVLAVTGSKRSSFLPDIPTMREQGFDVVVEAWLGVFGPARMPPQVVSELSSIIGEATKAAAFKDNLAKFGNEPTFQTPQQFVATIKSDLERWGPVVKASGFVAED
jgi:tripartite-type tricarboxylate transporter receptor subunit TctC